MSTQLEFAGALRPIDRHATELAHEAALASPRHRAIVRYHAHEEPLQRMLNAMEPGTYVRPHRHLAPPKLEVFLALVGRARLLVFDDQGTVIESVVMEAAGPCHGAEIPAGTWHSVVCEAPGTVLYELIEGPYTAANHKDFAPWAPPEESPEAGAYLARLHATRSSPC